MNKIGHKKSFLYKIQRIIFVNKGFGLFPIIPFLWLLEAIGFPLCNRQRRHHGCAGEAEWSMDATFRRLPEKRYTYGKS